MNGPQVFLEHLRNNNYHPRSDAHSNALCLGILSDLIENCPSMKQQAAAGEIVYQLNHTVTVSYQKWNIDLAIGPPAGAPRVIDPSVPIQRETPAAVELAIEAKGVMTEHGKARHNRLRDLHAFHSHAHLYNSRVVAGAVVVVNISENYWSPTRPASEITTHHNIQRLGAETVDLFRNIPLRNSEADGPGLEAACVLVVDHDNLSANPDLPPTAPDPRISQLIIKPPAPQVGDPLHYASFIYRLCQAFKERWR